MEKYEDISNDIFVCGFCHKSYIKTRISNLKFLYEKKINKNYTIEFDTLTNTNYKFIEDFYTDIHLNLTYFYEHFILPDTKESIELYDSIKKYYIIFIQLNSSYGDCLNISNLLKKYINDDNVLLICNDINLYDIEKNSKKYELCNPFVYNKIINYNKTIKNSDEIYI
jgi:hypothetical protein